MSQDASDPSRRLWVGIACGAGAVGGIAAAVPFVSSFAPSERAKAAGAAVEVDIRTLKHGEIKSLDMPAMTMVFVVKDKAMLDSVKAGDKVRFKAVSDAGKITVTEMQVMR